MFQCYTFMSITPLASFDLSNLMTGAEDKITDDFDTSTIIRTVGRVVCKFCYEQMELSLITKMILYYRK
jgi:hypothetical protein